MIFFRNLVLSFGLFLLAAGATFAEEKAVSRGEFVKMMVDSRLEAPADFKEKKNCFVDTKGHELENYICLAREKGWINGYGDGTFKADKEIMVIEALKVRWQARSAGAGTIQNYSGHSWYSVLLYSDSGIPASIESIEDTLTEEEAAELIRRMDKLIGEKLLSVRFYQEGDEITRRMLVSFPTKSGKNSLIFENGNIYPADLPYMRLMGDNVNLDELFFEDGYWQDSLYAYNLNLLNPVIKIKKEKGFKILSELIVVDDKNVYINGDIVEGAEPSTFEIVGAPFYFKDQNSAYFFSHAENKLIPMEGADAKTFKAVVSDDGKYSVVADKAALFYQDNSEYFRLSGVDLETFEVIDREFMKDKNRIYIIVKSSINLRNSRWLEQGIDLGKTGKVVVPVEVPSSENFEVLGGYYWTDGTAVYYLNKRLEGSDPETFVMVQHPDYAKDENQVYSQSSIVENADPATFKAPLPSEL